MANKKHGGKRKGAGRKPAPEHLYTKKLRASEEEWEYFLSMLTGDARKDFTLIATAVKLFKESEKR